MNNGRWTCWTHGCQGARKAADAVELVQRVLNIDCNGAMNWLEEFLGIKEYGIEIESKTRALDILRPRLTAFNKVLPNSDLDKFALDSTIENSYYQQRGYAPATLDYFGVRYCLDQNSKFYNRAIIPIHDTNGNLIGISGRWMGDQKADDTNKFIHTYGMKRALTLYNWHRADKYLNCGSIILVEGPGATWGLHQIGVFNVVGILGVDIAEEQVKILESCSKINTTIICLDAGSAGSKGAQRTARLLNGKTNIQIVYLPDDIDLDTISAAKFQQLYAARRNLLL
jgi:hypothetical protein